MWSKEHGLSLDLRAEPVSVAQVVQHWFCMHERFKTEGVPLHNFKRDAEAKQYSHISSLSMEALGSHCMQLWKWTYSRNPRMLKMSEPCSFWSLRNRMGVADETMYPEGKRAEGVSYSSIWSPGNCNISHSHIILFHL